MSPFFIFFCSEMIYRSSDFFTEDLTICFDIITWAAFAQGILIIPIIFLKKAQVEGNEKAFSIFKWLVAFLILLLAPMIEVVSQIIYQVSNPN